MLTKNTGRAKHNLQGLCTRTKSLMPMLYLLL
jgi:hypothetical protein